jgi:hypothetical protein
VFVAETITFGRTAPVESWTIPVKVAVEVCPQPASTLAAVRRQTAQSKASKDRSEFVENIVMTRVALKISTEAPVKAAWSNSSYKTRQFIFTRVFLDVTVIRVRTHWCFPDIRQQLVLENAAEVEAGPLI